MEKEESERLSLKEQNTFCMMARKRLIICVMKLFTMEQKKTVLKDPKVISQEQVSHLGPKNDCNDKLLFLPS